MDKKEIAIFVLVILLILAISYIGIVKLREREAAFYQQGILDGSQSALMQIFDKTSNCLTVPLTFENKTNTLVATECLQQNPNANAN